MAAHRPLPRPCLLWLQAIEVLEGLWGDLHATTEALAGALGLGEPPCRLERLRRCAARWGLSAWRQLSSSAQPHPPPLWEPLLPALPAAHSPHLPCCPPTPPHLPAACWWASTAGK